MKEKKTFIGLGTLLAIMAQTVSATADAASIIKTIICNLVPEIINICWALALLVFIYGGAKYAYSADDPGGRKQGKNIAINALIGFLIVAASKSLVEAIAFELNLTQRNG